MVRRAPGLDTWPAREPPAVIHRWTPAGGAWATLQVILRATPTSAVTFSFCMWFRSVLSHPDVVPSWTERRAHRHSDLAACSHRPARQLVTEKTVLARQVPCAQYCAARDLCHSSSECSTSGGRLLLPHVTGGDDICTGRVTSRSRRLEPNSTPLSGEHAGRETAERSF